MPERAQAALERLYQILLPLVSGADKDLVMGGSTGFGQRQPTYSTGEAEVYSEGEDPVLMQLGNEKKHLFSTETFRTHKSRDTIQMLGAALLS